MKRCLFFLLFLSFSTHIFSQTAPTNTRLFQINSLKGSELKIVESTPQNVYHVGTANSEIGFDGLSFSHVGVDDLYILKSNALTGENVWFKTFNAGVKGIISARSIYIDSGDNIFVYGAFSGTISAGATQANSSETVNGFLLKINSVGTAVWVKPLQLSTSIATNSAFLPKIAADDTDVFITYNATNLMRINNSNGNTIYDNVYPGIDFRQVLLKNSEIYVAGFSSNASTTFNSEIIEGPFQSFVIKGNKEAVFNSSLQTKNPGSYSNISDIAFANDGNLLISGFNTNRMDLKTSVGIHSYTYAPEQNFTSDKVYNFVAKIASDLNILSHFRTSGSLFSFSGNNPSIALNKSLKSKIVPFGNNASYRIILSRISTGLGGSYVNANGSSSLPYEYSSIISSRILSSDNNGNYTGEPQPNHTDFPISAASNFYTATAPNFRAFSTKVFQISSQDLMWSKEKISSVGGSLSNSFTKHLKSEASESFFTTIVEGKGNFFGKQVNNNDNQFTRFISRLGVDGLPKWIAKFNNDSGFYDLLGYGSKYACVDKNDNFYFLANTSGPSSSFTDAFGTTINFPQSPYLSAKILIKIDKNGKYLWSKIMQGYMRENKSSASLTLDNFDDIYVVGDNANNPFMTDGLNFNGRSFLMKINGATGSLEYSKSYTNLYVYSLHPTFDAENNLFMFVEPKAMNEDLLLDGVTIPANLATDLNFIMLKYDNSGNVIWGKNFYQNAPANSESYVFPNDVKFNGNDFILLGTAFGSMDNLYLGLDLAVFPNEFSTNTYVAPFMAKIATDGSVVWQDVFFNNGGAAAYTNVELDSQKNIYMYYYLKDKLKYRGTEYSFDAFKGNKIAQKFDTNGNLKYTVVVDKNYITQYPMIDVIKEDNFNLLAYTIENNILNYSIQNSNASNVYLATFGNLDQSYMTPKKGFLELNTTEISNNPFPSPNEFSFDLINNVNWTATSDQNWLTLSHERLTQKNAPTNTISDNGDAKIIINAETNSTGLNRTANIFLSGDGGVNSKTIAVTQSGLLATGETKNFVPTLYPNPTSDILNIETKQTISKIEIFDLSGKLLKSENGKDKKVSVSQLMKGMYLIKLYTENGIVNSKFIKN